MTRKLDANSRKGCTGEEFGAPTNDLAKRTVQCLICRWLTRLPWSLADGDARIVAEGLAQLHHRNEHPQAQRLVFELVHLGHPDRLEVEPQGEGHTREREREVGRDRATPGSRPRR